MLSELRFKNTLLSFTTLLVVLASSVHAAPPRLHQACLAGQVAGHFEPLRATRPTSFAMTEMLEDFAKKHQLPMKILEVGPPERRTKRLFVGLNFHNWEVYKDYVSTFNLENVDHPGLSGVLPLEFGNEFEAGHYHGGEVYVTGVLRPRPDIAKPIWMFGREDISGQQWWDNNMLPEGNRKQGIIGFAHLIGLAEDEKKATWDWLYPTWEKRRLPEKKGNCVSYIPNIELGMATPEMTAEERRTLFNELQLSRASTHTEIGRRLMHASNEKHSGVMVYLNGEKGLLEFEELEKHLPPEPLMPYYQVVKGVKFDRNAALAQAVATIPDGAKVFIPIGPGASTEGFSALVEHAKTLKTGVDVHLLVNGLSESEIKKGIETTDGKVRLHALFLGGNVRNLYSQGKVSYIPGNLADFAAHVKNPELPEFHYDAILVRVSPSDAQGHFSLGPNHDMIMTIIDARPGIKVIAEVNENIPFTTGDNFLTAKQITSMFKSDTKLATYPVVPTTVIEDKIGEHLSKLVKSGSTVQMGIGTLFGGFVKGLKEKGVKHLNFSTEMIGDAQMNAMKEGVADHTEGGFAYGSQSLYDFIHRNEKVVFKSTEYINDPGRVANIPGFVAINTGLQVDLYGQVNATFGAPLKGEIPNRISSPGGQVEFMTGAARSRGGKAIIAIRSAAWVRQEDPNAPRVMVSTIGKLYPGPVTTPHESVTHVVTEYGTAELRGKTDRQRAIAIIRIAHPKFREQLFNEALQNRQVKAQDKAWINFDEAPIQVAPGGH